MVLLIIIPMKNCYFIGKINPTFSDKASWIFAGNLGHWLGDWLGNFPRKIRKPLETLGLFEQMLKLLWPAGGGVPNRFWLNHKLRFAAVGHRKKKHIMYASNSSPGHVSSTKGEVVPPLSTFFGDQNDQRLDQLNLSQAVLKENPQKTTKNQAVLKEKPTENDQKSTSQLHVPGYQLGGLDPFPAPCPGSVRLEQNPRDVAGIMASPRFIENDTGLFQYKECFFSMLFLAIYGKNCSINYRSHIKQIKKNMECHNLDSNTFFFTIYVSIGSRETCSEATLC